MYYSNYVEYFSCLHISWFAKGVQRLLKATPTTILLLHLSQTIRMQHFLCKKTENYHISNHHRRLYHICLQKLQNYWMQQLQKKIKNKLPCIFRMYERKKNVLISIPSFVRQMNDGIIDKNRQKQVRKCSEFQANECFANL